MPPTPPIPKPHPNPHTPHTPHTQPHPQNRYMGNMSIDLPTKRFLSGSPVLLGGPNSTNPVAQDPMVIAEIEKLSGPVAKLEKQPAGG